MTKVSTRVVALATMVGITLAAASTASAALNLPVQSCNYVFTANLKAGMRNAEVRNLQKVLNAYPQTMVAASGAGSVGMETDYFGAATKAAVIKFQNLHMSDVLTPAGLAAGNGNVFALTRAMLNQICNGSTTPTTPTTPTTSGNVSVMLAANQPTNVLVAGQATARLADFSFTGNGTVTNVKLTRTGVSSNDTLSNVYLFDNGMRIAGPASVTTNGDINFGSVSGLFTVNGSKTLTVRSDIKSGVSGQSVGVNLVGFTVMGGSMASTMVMGTQLPVANVTLLTADFPTGNTTLPSLTSINAGTMNQTVWSRSLSVGTRAAKFHGLTVKMIGSAPVNSIANAKLFVDGSAVANGVIGSDGYVYFDTSSSPVNLTTGSHTFDVRADVVGGANRTFYVVMEQASDIRLEDSQVAGAFVTVTTNGGSTAVNLVGGVVTVNNGTLTITQDTAFNTTTSLVGGASNVKLAAYKFTSYGEDVKVTSLSFQPTFSGMSPANNNLANVGVYVNGGQVGSNQTAVSGTPLIYNNLGTNLLVSAGQTVIVEIRGDVMSSTSTNYTAGTIKFDINATANSVQGISSSNLVTNPTAGGQSLTIASSNVTFASTAGFAAATKAPNQTAVKVGSFTLQTGSAEGVNVTNVAVALGGTMIGSNQITNLTVKDGSTVVGNIVGNPTGTNNFSANITVPVSSTKILDVYADFGSSASGLTATTTMTVTYRGSSSNLSSVTSGVTGPTITANVASLLVSGVTFNTGASPVSQLVIGGNSSFGIATFNFKVNNAVAGGMIKDVTFTVPANTISAITMNGKTASVVGTTATIYNVGATVPADNSGINLPVTVALVCAGTANGCPANSPVTTNIQIPSITYFDGATTQTLTGIGTATSSSFYIVASKPSLAVDSVQKTGLVLGAENKIGEVTISADAAGKITLATTTFATSTSGITGAVISAPRIADGNTTIAGTVCNVIGNNVVCTMGGYEVSAGTSKTFSLYANVAGTPVASTVVSVGTSLTTAGFIWNDVVGGGTAITGANIYNFPTASYSVRQ